MMQARSLSWPKPRPVVSATAISAVIPGHLALVIVYILSPAQTRLTPLISRLHVDVDAPAPDFARRRSSQGDPAKYSMYSMSVDENLVDSS